MPAVREAVNEPVVAQWTPLLSAANGGRAEVIEALLSAPGIDVNARFKARLAIYDTLLFIGFVKTLINCGYIPNTFA